MSEEKSNRHGGAAMPRPETKEVKPLKAEDHLAKAEKIRLSMKDKEGPIQVVATRDGFYGNRRLVPGDKFTIPHGSHWGDWMKEI